MMFMMCFMICFMIPFMMYMMWYMILFLYHNKTPPYLHYITCFTITFFSFYITSHSSPPHRPRENTTDINVAHSHRHKCRTLYQLYLSILVEIDHENTFLGQIAPYMHTRYWNHSKHTWCHVIFLMCLMFFDFYFYNKPQ